MATPAVEWTAPGAAAHTGFTIAADGSYAARLIASAGGDRWQAERWTLDGPEPYAVPLPGGRSEEPGSEVLPLSDGRVLIRRSAEGEGLHRITLLYPTGPGTGEIPLGAVECERLSLLPPTPGGRNVYALAPGESSTAVWLVHGTAFGPERVAQVPGRCSGGVWLDRAGRLLALDRTDARGRTNTVAVDLERDGEVTPLLQLSEDSDDRLLLADPDSGLLLVRSDAPGDDRLGWGVLGSHRPVRFPEALRPGGVRLTPFAVQPGQPLLPESCRVALRVDGPNGTWVAVWRPSGGPGGTAGRKALQHLPAPHGWLKGTGLWTREGELRLPCATRQTPCGLARIRPHESAGTPRPPASGHSPGGKHRRTEGRTTQSGTPSGMFTETHGRMPGAAHSKPHSTTDSRTTHTSTTGSSTTGSSTESSAADPTGPVHPPAAPRPVPLQNAPLGAPLSDSAPPPGGGGLPTRGLRSSPNRPLAGRGEPTTGQGSDSPTG